MVRTHVVQNLFAFYQNEGKTLHTAKKELLDSFASTYSLYILLFDFVNELTAYAQERLEQSAAHARATHAYCPSNRRFIDNRFAKQVFDNKTVRHFMEEQKMGWDAGLTAVSSVYKQLLDTPFYAEYMEADEVTYEDDKRIWRRIFAELLPENEALLSALEEMEVALDFSNWTTDIDVVLSFVVKTVKRFKEEAGADQELLPMFDTEDELAFATDLFVKAVEHHDEYDGLVVTHLKNWDADRIAYMDKIILQTALTEILCFPEIALEISFNEYLEIAKEYSGNKSHIFINGIMTEILRELIHDNKLHKAAMLR